MQTPGTANQYAWVYRHLGNDEQPRKCFPAFSPRRAVLFTNSLPQRGQTSYVLEIGLASPGSARGTLKVVGLQGFDLMSLISDASLVPSTRSIGLPAAKLTASFVNLPEVMTETEAATSDAITPYISRITLTPIFWDFHCLH